MADPDCELCNGEGELVFMGDDKGTPCDCTKGERERIEAQREDSYERVTCKP